MKGLLILPGVKGKLGMRGGAEEQEENGGGEYGGPMDDGEDSDESSEDNADFVAVFESLASALGVKPKSPDKAASRLKTLIEMTCHKYMK